MSNPVEMTVQEVDALLKGPNPPRVVDVRQPAEWELVRMKDGVLLSQELLEEMMESWDKDEPLVLYCHHGIRSMQAAMYFAQQGFNKVITMRGGINAWAREIDTSLPVY